MRKARFGIGLGLVAGGVTLFVIALPILLEYIDYYPIYQEGLAHGKKDAGTCPQTPGYRDLVHETCSPPLPDNSNIARIVLGVGGIISAGILMLISRGGKPVPSQSTHSPNEF